MKKCLKKNAIKLWWCDSDDDGSRHDGANPDMGGDCRDLWGDCTGLWGDLDNCELTDEELYRGVDIESLVNKEE